MRKRRLFALAALITAIAAASGCSGDDSATAGKSEEKQLIRITYGAAEIDGQSSDLNIIFEEFYKEHPNCEIVLEENGSALMAKIAADDAPDIIRVKSTEQLPTYVNKNIIMPLDDLLAESELYNEDDIYPLCRDSFTYDGKEFGKGKIYGLPKDWSTSAMWVNKTMLAEAGLDVPTIENPLSYDELAEYAKKLTKKDGGKVSVFGYIDITSPEIIAEKILNGKGKSMWSEDFSKTNLQDQDVRDAFKYVYDMKVNGYTSSPLNPIDGNGNQEFATGKTAINMFGLYSGNVYSKNAERTVDFEEMQLCPPPVVNDKETVKVTATPVGGVISARCKNLDLVFDCWEYIHLGTPAKTRASSGFNLPVSKSVAESVTLSNDFFTNNYNFAMELANLEYTFATVNPYVTNASVSGVMEKYFTPLLYGQYTFDEAMKLIESELQLLIDEGMAN